MEKLDSLLTSFNMIIRESENVCEYESKFRNYFKGLIVQHSHVQVHCLYLVHCVILKSLIES